MQDYFLLYSLQPFWYVIKIQSDRATLFKIPSDRATLFKIQSDRATLFKIQSDRATLFTTQKADLPGYSIYVYIYKKLSFLNLFKTYTQRLSRDIVLSKKIILFYF